jgi:hypothetical protein
MYRILIILFIVGCSTRDTHKLNSPRKHYNPYTVPSREVDGEVLVVADGIHITRNR